MTIVEFIGARLDEDQAAAEHALDTAHTHDGYCEARCTHDLRHDPARVLRQVERDRNVLHRHRKEDITGVIRIGGDAGDTCAGCGVRNGHRAWPCVELLDLAAVWVDHPNHQAHWTTA